MAATSSAIGSHVRPATTGVLLPVSAPLGRQCTLPDCEREATDPTHPGSLCGQHLDGPGDGEEGRSPTSTGGPFTRSTEATYPATLRERDTWVAWILDGAERKRPVAPWQTSHAYPVEWRNDLPADERPKRHTSRPTAGPRPSIQ